MVVAGGGTGGHLYPGLAVADELRRIRPDVRVVFVGARRGLEHRVLPERGEEHVLLPVQGIDRTRPWRAWRAVPALASSLATVRRLYRRFRPEAVVVTGGYAGAPAGIVAAWTGTPLILQEQNSEPGLTTRLLSRYARRVHVAFPEAAERLPPRVRSRVVVSGNPVRPPAAIPPAEARARLGLPPEGVVALVTGGSQGARALNAAVRELVRAVEAGGLRRPEGLTLLWITGPRHYEELRADVGEVAGDWVRMVPYVEDMPAALAAADFAVSRAGAMTTAEFLNQGLPAVLVPLPTAAADHQMRNARALEGAGAARVVPEGELDTTRLWDELVALAADADTRRRMREAALARARPGAAREIAADVASLLRSRGAA